MGKGHTTKGFTLLHFYCRHAYGIELVKKFCDKHRDLINSKSQDRFTPIMMCAYQLWIPTELESKEIRERIINYLLGQGAETHHAVNNGADLADWCKQYKLNVPSLASK